MKPKSKLSRFPYGVKQKRLLGFTLVELLVALVIGVLITVTLGSILVNILSDDVRQTSQTEVEQDIQSTLNYVTSDLGQAVYVYDGSCLQGQGTTSDANFCPGLVNHIPNFGTNIYPVLAMWVLDLVPYFGITGQIPTTCPSGALQVDCQNLQSARRAYTLVVYYMDTSTSADFTGPARLRRYVLRKYATLTSSSLSLTTGYVDPFPATAGSAFFRRWPYDGNNTNQQATAPSASLALAPVVADYVDGNLASLGATPVACRTNYVRTPLASVTGQVNSFYACVLNRSDTAASGSTSTDAGVGKNTSTFVYLRGNTQGKPGFTSPNSGVRPVVTAIILSKGVSDNNPYD
ncbi:hypothetical protein [Synechococcus sp. PCC 6312]|uniref:hypothetical protein n=1 Tax=Synechococcus sp. (strain ATCC 27167 / PCC 6312) TaxID=195253 RepID=UPI00029EE991|nr:hypothetical protein [Synechococcus sp. PCC 6312]AFY60665.1 hypothetical protein Syn6312_1501 [Synechococcus sp. PCC 6312]